MNMSREFLTNVSSTIEGKGQRRWPDGSGLVMTYKHLEEHSFTWPTIRNGVISLNSA